MIYRLRIIGVDASADLAVLEMINEGQIDFRWVGQHPSIIWGDEREVTIGKSIINISNPLRKDLQSFVKGNIRDNRWFDNLGDIQVSCVITTLLVYASSCGSPILDAETGLCLEIVSFGILDTLMKTEIGFGSGCGVSTIKFILDHIFNNRSVSPITANNGEQYLTNNKGYFGNIRYVGANTNNILTLHPNNYRNLQIRGFILTQIDPNGPFARPLNGATPVRVGDIIVWVRYNGKTTVIGLGDGQEPLGNVLWRINPSNNSNNIFEIGLIRNPNVNSRIEIVRVRMDINYNPTKERPPNSNNFLFFDNSNVSGCTNEHLELCPYTVFDCILTG